MRMLIYFNSIRVLRDISARDIAWVCHHRHRPHASMYGTEAVQQGLEFYGHKQVCHELRMHDYDLPGALERDRD
jgi:hypothetical protein